MDEAPVSVLFPFLDRSPYDAKPCRVRVERHESRHGEPCRLAVLPQQPIRARQPLPALVKTIIAGPVKRLRIAAWAGNDYPVVVKAKTRSRDEHTLCLVERAEALDMGQNKHVAGFEVGGERRRAHHSRYTLPPSHRSGPGAAGDMARQPEVCRFALVAGAT